MSVAANADDYTNGRVGIFFPANGETPEDGDLTGQCVTLLKWFFAEMCNGFPSPFAARGDARYVGKRLVAQGLAVEVPYDQRKRGDVVCYEYGTYGHIALQLSGGRVFEENVGIGAARRVLSDGTVVYASRIGDENETWRHDQHVYRLKSYIEGGAMANPNRGDVVNILGELWGRAPSEEDFGYTNSDWHDFIYGALSAYPYQDRKKQFAQALVDVETYKKGADFATSVAKVRADYIDRIRVALGVAPQTTEEATVQAIITKYNAEVESNKTLSSQNIALQGQLSEAQGKLDSIESGDAVILTREGWAGLFEAAKQLFGKKK